MATSLIWWEAAAAKLPSANAPAGYFLSLVNYNTYSLRFAGNAGAADEYCDFIGTLPDYYTDGGDVSMRIWWYEPAGPGVGENVSWDISLLGRVDDEVLDAAFTDVATVNDLTTAAGDVHMCTAALAAPTLVSGDLLIVRINRDHDEANGGTAMDEDAYLLGMQLVED